MTTKAQFIILCVLICVLVLMTGYLVIGERRAASLEQSPTFYPTYTPANTFTPYPTFTPAHTATPYPTYTPAHTATPYPTYTPFPTPTPTPQQIACNPSWRNIRGLRIPLGLSSDEMRTALENEILRTTRVVYLPDSENKDIQIYLTYLSPQLLEAAVLYTAVRDKLAAGQVYEMLEEIDQRFQTDNAIAFLLKMEGKDRRDTITLGPLEEHLLLVNQRQEEIPALNYTPSLAEELNMDMGGTEGYVLFPRSLGSQCKTTVDILQDHSFVVRAKDISGILTLGGLQLGDLLGGQVDIEGRDYSWTFDLIQDMALSDAMKQPLLHRVIDTIERKHIDDLLALLLRLVPLP